MTDPRLRLRYRLLANLTGWVLLPAFTLASLVSPVFIAGLPLCVGLWYFAESRDRCPNCGKVRVAREISIGGRKTTIWMSPGDLRRCSRCGMATR